MKIGTPVKFTRKDGKKCTGKVKSKPALKGNSLWLSVLDDAETKKVDGKLKLTWLRPSQVTPL